MSETKHTPLPWKSVEAVNQDTFKGYFEIYMSGHTEPIASVSPYLHPADANAKFIITSVNARPQVEELVRTILEIHDEEIHPGWSYPTPEEWNDKIVAKAREVESALGGKAE